jgi:hypothetical protein
MALDGPERGFDSRAESCGETQMTNTDGESLFDTLDSFADDDRTFGASTNDYGGDGGLRDNREGDFSLSTGRFRNPETGEFEDGSSPPDYDSEANRYRAENGQFKSQSADLYDERAEVRFDDLGRQG